MSTQTPAVSAETPKVAPLTQGHLEAYQEAFRAQLDAAKAEHDESVCLYYQPLDLELTLLPPARFAMPFYAAFLEAVRAKAPDGRLSVAEQRGLMIRAALTTGWLSNAPWTVEEVPTLPAKTATWLGAKLDEVYSDYDYALDVAQVKAAHASGWFADLETLPEEPSDLEALAQTVKKAYRAATELDPE